MQVAEQCRSSRSVALHGPRSLEQARVHPCAESANHGVLTTCSIKRADLVHGRLEHTDNAFHRYGQRAVTAPCGVIDDDGDRRISDAELAGEDRFRHAGHADHCGSITAKSIDLGRGFQSWTGNCRVHAGVVDGNAGRARRGETSLAQLRGIGVREVNMDDSTITAVEKRAFPATGVVDQLMREHEIADRIFATDAADRSHCQNVLRQEPFY